jgi:hypothetical protein
MSIEAIIGFGFSDGTGTTFRLAGTIFTIMSVSLNLDMDKKARFPDRSSLPKRIFYRCRLEVQI